MKNKSTILGIIGAVCTLCGFIVGNLKDEEDHKEDINMMKKTIEEEVKKQISKQL